MPKIISKVDKSKNTRQKIFAYKTVFSAIYGNLIELTPNKAYSLEPPSELSSSYFRRSQLPVKFSHVANFKSFS